MAAAGVIEIADIRRKRVCDALVAKMAKTSGAPDWNGDDCKDFAAAPIVDGLGIDPVARFRGRWKTKRGALRVLLRMGYRSVLEACEDIAKDLGWPRIDPHEAESGDFGLAMVADVPTCVIRHPSGLWVCRSMNGYACLPVNVVVAAWRCV